MARTITTKKKSLKKKNKKIVSPQRLTPAEENQAMSSEGTGPAENSLKVVESSREGSIETGDEPIKITSSCKIQEEIYHMVTFKQKFVNCSGQRQNIREQIKPRLYTSKKLRQIACDFLIDFYES